MVFSGLYPIDGTDYPVLREALDKLKLNDAAARLRAGDLRRARLRLPLRLPRPAAPRDRPRAARARVRPRPDLDGAQRGLRGDDRRQEDRHGHQPERVPRAARSPRSSEPIVKAAILAPKDYVGTIMELCQSRRGTCSGMDYLGEDRVEMRYTMPLGEIVFDFFDHLKSRPAGYASLDYEPVGEQEADLVKVDILLQGEPGRRVQRDRAQGQGLRLRRADDRTAAQGSSRASSSRCRSRPPSARGSSRARPSARCARTCSPSATAVTSPASASCSRSRRRARSA